MSDSAPLFSAHYSPSPPPLSPDEHDEEEDNVNQPPLPLHDEQDEEEQGGDNIKPIGSVVKVSYVEGSRRNHFIGFEANGVCYELEDVVLVVPDDVNLNTKPSVAMIKDISATEDGRITVTGQRFYRLEVAVNENGEKWESSESRELFYSFDKTEFSADLVMHKCHVHFIPPDKEIPRAKDQPGFVVRKVYDSKYKELTELVNTGYDDCKQHEINLLVEKTSSKIPQLEDDASPKSN